MRHHYSFNDIKQCFAIKLIIRLRPKFDQISIEPL